MKKFLSKNYKRIVSSIFVMCMVNTQAFAQVQTGPMQCYDIKRNVNFSVHFKGGEVFLLLKGHTYRVPYFNSFVSPEGERWSAYEHTEIRVSTTAPYDKYIVISTMPPGTIIASTYCE